MSSGDFPPIQFYTVGEPAWPGSPSDRRGAAMKRIELKPIDPRCQCWTITKLHLRAEDALDALTNGKVWKTVFDCPSHGPGSVTTTFELASERVVAQ